MNFFTYNDCELNKTLYAVTPNIKEYGDMPQLTDKDHPTVPIRFKETHTPANSLSFFKKIREHGKAAPGRWGDYDVHQTEGPFADWNKHERSTIFTEEEAIDFLGVFQWPHNVDVRKPIAKELILPLFAPVFMKTGAHKMMHGRPPLDLEQNREAYMPLLVGTRDKENRILQTKQEELAASKPEPITTSHVVIAFQDKKMHDGYRVGELVQERSDSKKKTNLVVKTFKHTPAYNTVKGKVGFFWTVKVRELTTTDSTLDADKMEWNRHGNMDELNWDFNDIIAMFDAHVVTPGGSCMERQSKKQNKPSKSVRIPTIMCDMIKTKITGRAFKGPDLVVFEAMDDITKNYSGTEECHADHDESFMSGFGLVGTRIAYAYADENKVVTWFAGKVVAWRTKEDASIEYNVIYDNKDIEWQCLSVDDYGAKFYEGAAGWVALKSIAFRVGDTVCITEKILQSKSVLVDPPQKGTRRMKRKRVNTASMRYNGRDARKQKGASHDESEKDEEVCDADDSTLVNRAKEVVKETVTDPLELPKEVTHVDATFFGTVEAVTHTKTSSSIITVVFVTSVQEGKDEEKLFKREKFGTKTRPEGLLRKSSATINDQRHYSEAAISKYSRQFQGWMSNETQKGKEREIVIGKESDADFSLRAVGLKVVANTTFTRRMRLSGPLIEVVKGSKGFIVEVNKENVDEFSVNFENVDDIDVVSVFRKEFDIINAT